MEQFRRVLRRAEHRLKAPEPERSRALAEIASDLEDLYRVFRERGLDEGEARRRAARWLAPSDEALNSLGEVHIPGIERLLRRVGGSTRGRVELAALVATSLLAAAGGAYGALSAGVLEVTSPALWFIMAPTGIGAGLSLSQAYVLFVRGDRLGAGWRHGLDGVLVAAGAVALSGLLAAGLRVTMTAPGAQGIASGVPWLVIVDGSALAALGLSAALLLALSWLLLHLRAASVQQARDGLRNTLAELGGDDPDLDKVDPESDDRETALRLEETP